MTALLGWCAEGDGVLLRCWLAALAPVGAVRRLTVTHCHGVSSRASPLQSASHSHSLTRFPLDCVSLLLTVCDLFSQSRRSVLRHSAAPFTGALIWQPV